MSTSSATASTRPSASWPAPDTRIDLGYEYLHDRRTTDRGVPSIVSGEPLEGFDRTFFGDPDKSFAKADVHLAQLRRRASSSAKGLTLRNRTLYGDYDKFYQNIFPNSAVHATRPARSLLSRLQRARNDRQNLFSQTDLSGKAGSAASTRPCWSASSSGRQDRPQPAPATGSFADQPRQPDLLDVADPTVDRRRRPSRSSANGANNGIKANVAAVYVQDQIRPADWLEIVAGLRFDRFKLDVDNLQQRQQTSAAPTISGRRASA